MVATTPMHLAASRAIQDFVRRASDAPLPGPGEAERLASRASQGDDSARDLLVQAHLRLVVDEAIRYRGEESRVRDLIPLGMAALESAAEGYAASDGQRFTSFARARIRQAMGRRFATN